MILSILENQTVKNGYVSVQNLLIKGTVKVK